jgi:hypothetical protein
MGRIPCASLIAFILFGMGITVYLGSCLSAFDTVKKFFKFDLE